MSYLAVIDTETNWDNQVMSIGVVLGDRETMRPVEARYYVLTPECEIGGMYDGVLDLAPVEKTLFGSRQAILKSLAAWLRDRDTEGKHPAGARKLAYARGL